MAYARDVCVYCIICLLMIMIIIQFSFVFLFDYLDHKNFKTKFCYNNNKLSPKSELLCQETEFRIEIIEFSRKII